LSRPKATVHLDRLRPPEGLFGRSVGPSFFGFYTSKHHTALRGLWNNVPLGPIHLRCGSHMDLIWIVMIVTPQINGESLLVHAWLSVEVPICFFCFLNV